MSPLKDDFGVPKPVISNKGAEVILPLIPPGIGTKDGEQKPKNPRMQMLKELKKRILIPLFVAKDS